MKYALACVRADSGALPVLQVDGALYSLPELVPGLITHPERGLLDVLEQWATAEEKIAAAVQRLGATSQPRLVIKGAAEYLAPIQYPTKIICTGTNYYDHLRKDFNVLDFDKTKYDILYFMKHSRALVGSGPSVRYPSQSRQLDWEVELVVVFGKRGRRIAASDALSYVAGYSIGLDLSARDIQFNPRHRKQFDVFAGKSFDDSSPMGPFIVPASSVDPRDLELRLWVNGALKQDSHTREMIWSLQEQISELSQHMTIEPGDVLYTGSPAGVGMASKTFLQVGDRVDAEITGLGKLSVQIIADPDADRARQF